MLIRNSEIGELLDKFSKLRKKDKFKYLFFSFIYIQYFCLPSFNIPFMEYNNFRFTSLMEQRAIENKLDFMPKQEWVNIEDVNQNLLKSIISVEDGNFFFHKGIDWKELRYSVETNLKKRRISRGGSTITMQLAKNLFLRTDRNFFRKAKEFIIAMRIEKEVSKYSILENYVNAIEWGNGIFGIKKASEIYFKKSPKDLNINEISRLVAVIPSPLNHSPLDNSRYVKRRSQIVKARYKSAIIPTQK